MKLATFTLLKIYPDMVISPKMSKTLQLARLMGGVGLTYCHKGSQRPWWGRRGSRLLGGPRTARRLNHPSGRTLDSESTKTHHLKH